MYFGHTNMEDLKDMEDLKVIQQLGEDGAQGVVSLVEFPNGLRSAMKQFKKNKSTTRIQQEAKFQQAAADAGSDIYNLKLLYTVITFYLLLWFLRR